MRVTRMILRSSALTEDSLAGFYATMTIKYFNPALRSKWLGFAVLGILLGSFIAFRVASPSSSILTAKSPAGTYTVNITGQRHRPRVPLVDHTVRFNVFKNGQIFVRENGLHSGDWLDPSFDILYPQHQWINEKTLQLYREEYRKKVPHDTIIVRNNTNRKIAYALIKSIDLVILLELEAGEMSKFSVSPARANLKWTSIEGEFIGGEKIKSSGVDFKIPKQAGPISYQISISENGSAIESSQVEKYTSNDPG